MTRRPLFEPSNVLVAARVTQRLHDWLKQYAEDNYQTLSELQRAILEEFMFKIEEEKKQNEPAKS